ncbi:hypothetical protein M3622_21840, partial [Bacillus subtilis]|nr:hypothetical protein [Bacillus subtilis]
MATTGCASLACRRGRCGRRIGGRLAAIGAAALASAGAVALAPEAPDAADAASAALAADGTTGCGSAVKPAAIVAGLDVSPTTGALTGS